jgi:hypothetical protein
MKFKITTSCTAITDYIVEADSAEAAREQYEDGNFESENITDYQNEEILDIKEEDGQAVTV